MAPGAPPTLPPRKHHEHHQRLGVFLPGIIVTMLSEHQRSTARLSKLRGKQVHSRRGRSSRSDSRSRSRSRSRTGHYNSSKKGQSEGDIESSLVVQHAEEEAALEDMVGGSRRRASTHAGLVSTRNPLRDVERPLHVQRTGACSIFVDICNFTGISEQLAAQGKSGVEALADYLNSCFAQLVRLVTKAGGDIIKFAGDAMIAIWAVDDENSLQTATHRAVQCALDIQDTVTSENFFGNLSLGLKIGVGSGVVTILHLGGEMDGSGVGRREYVALGPPLEQSFGAEHRSSRGDVVLSPHAWHLVHSFVRGERIDEHEDYWRVTRQTKQIIKKRAVQVCGRVPSLALAYVPRSVGAILCVDQTSKKDWISEIRLVTVLFVNFGFDEEERLALASPAGMRSLQQSFCAVQRVVFDYEGTINKLLVDDKGVTMLAVFGLPPLAHENDATRAVLASLGIGTLLNQLSLAPTIGVASGDTFCGVIGHRGGRKEYTVIGDVVNLAARLVMYAQSESLLVITDSRTRYLCKDSVEFEQVTPTIQVKGKQQSITIHFPYRKMVVNPMQQSMASSPHSCSTVNEDLFSSDVPQGDNNDDQPWLTEEHDLVGDVKAKGLHHTESDNDDDLWLVEWRDQVRRYADVRKLRLTQHNTNVLVAAGDGGDVTKEIAMEILRVLYDSKRSANGVLLQGDIGSGKTRVLSYLHQLLTVSDDDSRQSSCKSNQEKSLHPNHDLVLCVVGNPFERGMLARPCGVWVDAVNDLIDQTLLRLNYDRLMKAGEMKSSSSSSRVSAAAAAVAASKDKKKHAHNRWRSKKNKNEEDLCDDRHEDENNYNNNNNNNYESNLTHRKRDHHGLSRHEEAARNGVPILQSAVWGRDAALVPIDTSKESLMKSSSFSGADSATFGGNDPGFEIKAMKKARAELLSDPRARRQIVEQWLEHAHPGSGVHAYAHVLNEPLGIDLLPFDDSGKGNGSILKSCGDVDLPRKQSMESNAEDVSGHELLSVLVELFRGVAVCLNEQNADKKKNKKKNKNKNELENKTNALYVLVDDAMHLDVSSLRITRALADAPFVRLVIASRPVDEHSFPVAQARRICQTLFDLPTVHMMRMPPLTNTQVCALARSTLGVLSIPKEIEVALCIKSRGNPLIVLEMVNNMVAQETIIVDKVHQTLRTSAETATALQDKRGDGSATKCQRCHTKFSTMKRKHNCKRCGGVFCSDCSPSSMRAQVLGYDSPQRHCIPCYRATMSVDSTMGDFFPDTSTVQSPTTNNILNMGVAPPVSVVSVLGMWLDRLPLHEQLLLKVASVAQRNLRFTRELAIQSFPLTDVSASELSDAFDHLEDVGMIKKVTVAASPVNASSMDSNNIRPTDTVNSTGLTETGNLPHPLWSPGSSSNSSPHASPILPPTSARLSNGSIGDDVMPSVSLPSAAASHTQAIHAPARLKIHVSNEIVGLPVLAPHPPQSPFGLQSGSSTAPFGSGMQISSPVPVLQSPTFSPLLSGRKKIQNTGSTDQLKTNNNGSSGSSSSSSKNGLPEIVAAWRHEYVFCNFLMPEVLLQRMPSAQVEGLRARVSELKEQHEKLLRLIFREKAGSHLCKSDAVKSGMMTLAKHSPAIKGLVGGQFKRRWATLMQDRIELYPSSHAQTSLSNHATAVHVSVSSGETESNGSVGSNSSIAGARRGGSAAGSMKEALLLRGGHVAMSTRSVTSLELTVKATIRQGVIHNTPKTYVISFPDAASPQGEVKSWLFMIKFAIEACENEPNPEKCPDAYAPIVAQTLSRRRSSLGSMFRTRSTSVSSVTDMDDATPPGSPNLLPKSRLRNKSWFGGNKTGVQTDALGVDSLGMFMAESLRVKKTYKRKGSRVLSGGSCVMGNCENDEFTAQEIDGDDDDDDDDDESAEESVDGSFEDIGGRTCTRDRGSNGLRFSATPLALKVVPVLGGGDV